MKNNMEIDIPALLCAGIYLLRDGISDVLLEEIGYDLPVALQEMLITKAEELFDAECRSGRIHTKLMVHINEVMQQHNQHPGRLYPDAD